MALENSHTDQLKGIDTPENTSEAVIHEARVDEYGENISWNIWQGGQKLHKVCHWESLSFENSIRAFLIMDVTECSGWGRVGLISSDVWEPPQLSPYTFIQQWFSKQLVCAKYVLRAGPEQPSEETQTYWANKQRGGENIYITLKNDKCFGKQGKKRVVSGESWWKWGWSFSVSQDNKDNTPVRKWGINGAMETSMEELRILWDESDVA